MPQLFRYRVLIFEDENLPALIAHEKLCEHYCLGTPSGTHLVNESYIANNTEGVFLRAEDGYFCDFLAFKRVESARRHLYHTAEENKPEPIDFTVIDWRDTALVGRSSNMGLNIAAHCLLTNPSVSIVLTTMFPDDLDNDRNIDAKWLWDRIVTFRRTRSADLSSNLRDDKGTVWDTQFMFDQERDKTQRLLNRRPIVAAAVIKKIRELPVKYNELKQYRGPGHADRAKRDFVDFLSQDLCSDDDYLYRLPQLFPFHTAKLIRDFNTAITAPARPRNPLWEMPRREIWKTCAELLWLPRSEIVRRFIHCDFPYSVEIGGVYVTVPGLHSNQQYAPSYEPLQLAVLQQEIPRRAAELRAEFRTQVPANDPVFTVAEQLATDISNKVVTKFSQVHELAHRDFRVRPLALLEQIDSARTDFSNLRSPSGSYWFYGVAKEVEAAMKGLESAISIIKVTAQVSLPGDDFQALTVRFEVTPGSIELACLKSSIRGHGGLLATALLRLKEYFTVFLGDGTHVLCLEDLIEGVTDSTKVMRLSFIEVSSRIWLEKVSK